MANRISGFFNKKKGEKQSNSRQDGPALVQTQYPLEQGGANTIFPKQLIAGSGQSVGLQRDHNEDALFCLTSVLADGIGNDYFGLFIIADGMGGHRNGEVASSVTCRTISRYLLSQIVTNSLTDSPAISDEDLHGFLNKAVEEAQKRVLQSAPGGGTTATIALWRHEQITIAQVGDSRAYFILPDGKLQKITRDHSLVQRLLDLNEITQSEAELHPQKNVLLRAIGQPDTLKADINTVQVPQGAKLMLCSDGLWGVVDETTISSIVLHQDDPTIACKQLVAAANQNGGPDNISVIIAGRKG